MRKLAILILLLATIYAFAEVDSLNMRMLDVYVSDLELEYAPKVIEYHDGFIYWGTPQGLEILHITDEGTIEHDTSLFEYYISGIAFKDTIAFVFGSVPYHGFIALNINDAPHFEIIGSVFADSATAMGLAFFGGYIINDTLMWGAERIWIIENDPLESSPILHDRSFEYIDYPYAYGLTGGYEDHEFYEEYWGILKVMNLEDATPTWRELYVGPRGEDYNGFEDMAVKDSLVFLTDYLGGPGLTFLSLNSARTHALSLLEIYEPLELNIIKNVRNDVISSGYQSLFVYSIDDPLDIELTNKYEITDSVLVIGNFTVFENKIVASILFREGISLMLLEYEDMHNINEQGLLDKPDKLHLDIFPNPFNSSINISGAVEACYAVYDIYGNMVSNIANDYTQSTAWQPSQEVVSGVYIIKASTRDGATSTKPVSYVK